MHDDDAIDLRRFAEEGDEDAFAALVGRHLGLVYSAALRQLNGDAHLARDAAQTVFADLARKAGSLVRRADTLTGWLYTSTHHAAARAVRTEQRRRRREQEAHAMNELQDRVRDAEWAQIRPEIDTLMQRLSQEDRDALVQRFFADRSYADMGRTSGVSESGARMRVDRALEKLRVLLERRGIHSTATALGAVLATEAVAAPPVGLATSVAAVALTKAATTSAAGAITFMGMTKLQMILAATAAVAGTAWVGKELQIQRAAGATFAADSTGEHARAALPEQPSETLTALTRESDRASALRAEKAALEEQIDHRRAAAEVRSASTHAGRSKTGARSLAIGIPEETEIEAYQGLDVKPQPVKRPPPSYPAELRGIPGEAEISFIITSSGAIADVRPEDATHPAFALAAMDAIAQWEYTAGRKGDRPVNVRVTMPVRFTWTEDDWF